MFPRLISALVIASAGTAVSVLISGCQTSRQEDPVPVVAPVAFSISGNGPAPAAWWEAFDSSELNALVASALGSNMDLQTAWYRLREAEAIARQAGSSRWPFLDLEAGARWQRPEPAGGDTFDLGLSAGYEVDLWGRVRSGAQARQLQAQASAEDFQTAAVTVSAEVTSVVFQVITARQQIELLSSQVDINEKVLESLRNRFASGQILRGDLLRQSQLVEQTRDQLLQAESQLQVLKQRLAVLLGRPVPSTDALVLPKEFPQLPALPSTGMPGDLLQQRPDVRAAYLRLQAADREAAVAMAERLPRISLNASYFTEESDSIDLFDEWIRTLAANLALPIFDAGGRRAEVDRTQAVKMQRLYQYGQVTLEAFREVESALIQEQKQAQRLESITEQVRLADETYEQLRRQYLNGVSDFLDVLTALTSQQRLQRDLLTSKLALFEFRIALYRALAGQVVDEQSLIEPEPTS